MKTHWKRLYLAPDGEHAATIEFGDGQLDLVVGHEARAYLCQAAPGGRLLLRHGDQVHSGYAVRDGDRLWIHLAGSLHRLQIARGGGRVAARAEGPGRPPLRAPLTGAGRGGPPAPGAAVNAGQSLVILEAMKMEHVLKSPRDGRVAAVHCEPGELVDLQQVLLRLAPAQATGAANMDQGSGGQEASPTEGRADREEESP